MIIYTCQLLPINPAPNNTDQPTPSSKGEIGEQTRRQEPVP